jgi:uncharacterized protein (DUF952 family)
MSLIYHLTTQHEWKQALSKGFYEAPSLAEEGFIHCSTEQQVAGVLQRYFKGRSGLVKLTIDTDKLTAPLRYELAPSVQEEFPHIYGSINLDAVIATEALPD